MAIRKIVSRSLGDGTVNKQELDVSASGAGTGAAILPSGTTGQRPGSATEGMLRYNSTTGLYEQYTATGWQAVDAPPTVSSISPNTFNGESGTTITLTGTGFKTGCTVKFISNGGTEYTATTTTFVSSTSVTATTPQDFTVADEPFDVKIINASGLAGTLENALDCGGSPSFTTASGSLGTIYDSQRSSYSLSTAAATDPDTSATISYAITSGALPTGLSLNSSTAAITGTASAVVSDTTSNFTITATDNAGNTASRAFSIVTKAPTVVSFTSTGSSTWTVPSGISSVQVLVVAGGAGGGGSASGGGGGAGGGAGGYVEMSSFPVTPGGSVSYSVGAGGVGGPAENNGNPGSPSTFDSLTAIGGGGGGNRYANYGPGGGSGGPGGSGGGAAGGFGGANPAGSALQNSQPGNSGTFGFGNPGGATQPSPDVSGGGGGASTAGGTANNNGTGVGGTGGAGKASSITGSSVTRAGGGGGGGANGGGPGGPGGGGTGAGGNGVGGSPTAGSTNTGSGGGGGWASGPGPNGSPGGPGIIIVKY